MDFQYISFLLSFPHVHFALYARTRKVRKVHISLSLIANNSLNVSAIKSDIESD